MATKTQPETEEVVGEKERSPMFEGARKVLLASIGVVALAQEEIEAFIQKLVERGEIAEKDGKKLLHEIKDKRKIRTEEAEEEVNKRVIEILDTMNVPTKTDIEELGKMITTLTKKVDELKKAQE